MLGCIHYVHALLVLQSFLCVSARVIQRGYLQLSPFVLTEKYRSLRGVQKRVDIRRG